MTAGIPLVSVVIPTYNRVTLLAEAVRTVLAQTCRSLELIVVDDGSTDHTGAMLAGVGDPRVQLIALPHSGSPGRARNVGIERARGRYVAFLDSDDLWDPSKLEDQLAALSEWPECRWCTTGLRIVDDTGAPHPRWRTHPEPPEGWIFERLVQRQAGMSISTLLVERALLLEVGGFDETFRWGEDYDLRLRLALRSPIARVVAARVQHRIHPNQFTRRPRALAWQAPQLLVLRTLVKMARSAPSWGVRSLCIKEAFKVGASYLTRRVRGAVRRLMGPKAETVPARRG